MTLTGEARVVLTGGANGMKVYTLTGKSGTGKSFQAMNLCKEFDIESIIDDGIFIYQNRVMAGTSAKREKTKVGAIKAAMFIREKQREEVKRSIESVKPESILVIGTSDKMAEEICEQLGLPEIYRRIHIEDITTEREREKAFKQRRIQGKHVIPVPSMQLKRDFAGYFINPLKILKSSGVFGIGQYTEKTVVRPTYSYSGDFTISDKVITDIAKCAARRAEGVDHVISVYANTMPGTLRVQLSLAMKENGRVWDEAVSFQKKLADVIEFMTAFNVVEVAVTVDEVC